MPVGTIQNPALAEQLLDAIDAAFGLHPGFRPAHAKGLMCSTMFTPSGEAAKLTRAPHAIRPSTPVTVRYSDGTGLPTIPDNDPARSGPRGFAVRFHLAEHVHTDVVAHSTDGFPVRTGEEFLEFTRATGDFAFERLGRQFVILLAKPSVKTNVRSRSPFNREISGTLRITFQRRAMRSALRSVARQRFAAATLTVRSSSRSQFRASAQTVNFWTSRSSMLSRRASARAPYFNNESNEYS